MRSNSDATVGPFVSLNAARRRPEFTVDGNHVDLSTMHRYATRGSRGVILRTVRLGGRRCTTPEWCRDFIEQLSTGTATAVGERAPSRRLRQMRAAEAELAAGGII